MTPDFPKAGETARRVLFVVPPLEDYLSDSLLHGLKCLLGAGVVDVPEATRMYRTLSSEARGRLRGHGFTLYGLLDPLPCDRSRIPGRLGDFDLVVFGSIWQDWATFEDWAPHLSPSRTVIVDGADSPATYPYAGHWLRDPRRILRGAVHRRYPYFKREWTPETLRYRCFKLLPLALARRWTSDMALRRIAFSIPEDQVASEPARKDRLLATHVVDPEVRELLGGLGPGYAFTGEGQYRHDLLRSKFAVTTRRSGWDCLRHYEIAASGCVPCFRQLAEKPSTCAPHGLDESNVVSYRNAEHLREQITSMDEARYHELRRGALRWAHDNSTRARARAFLAELGYVTAGEPGRVN